MCFFWINARIKIIFRFENGDNVITVVQYFFGQSVLFHNQKLGVIKGKYRNAHILLNSVATFKIKARKINNYGFIKMNIAIG